MEAVEDFYQLKLRFVDQTQFNYELVRTVVLLQGTVTERSAQTQIDPVTIREKAKRFVEQGMPGLIDGRTLAAGRKGQEFPEPVAGYLLYCKKIWPAIHLRELVRIVDRKFGYKTNHHTVKAFLDRYPIPVQLELHLKTFRDFEDAFQARYEVIRLYFEGWNKRSIAGVLKLSLNHVCNLIAAYTKDGFAALEDSRTRPALHPDNQLTLPFLQETFDMQRQYPRVGAYRMRALLKRKRKEAGNTQPVPSQSSVSRAMAVTRLFMGAPAPWPRPPLLKASKDPAPLPFDPIYRHRYWFIDVRYLVKLDGRWVYSIAIIEGYSRCILAGMASAHQDELAILQLLHAALAEHGCPEAIVSDGGSVFRGAAYTRVLDGLGIDHPVIEKRQAWQNLIEAQFKVQLRMADVNFERAASLEEVETSHADFVHTFNTTAHWAHRDRSDGLTTPEEVLAGMHGRPIDPEELRRQFRGLQTERIINAHGRVRLQHFSLYAERGLSQKRVSIWMHQGLLRIEYEETLLAQYAYQTQSHRRALKAVSKPVLYPTRFASTQMEILELDEDQWLKVLHLPAPAPRRPPVLALSRQMPLLPGFEADASSLTEALFSAAQRGKATT